MRILWSAVMPPHLERRPPTPATTGGRRGQPAATSKAVTLQVSRLNSTPSRWIDTSRPRYLAA